MYLVIELQTNLDGTVGNIITKYDTLAEAERQYFLILAAATISALPVHAAVILTNSGTLVRSEYYRHEQEEEET